MAFVFKAITPPRLKDAAMRRELRNGIRKVGQGIDREFAKTYRTWEHKPAFTQTYEETDRRFSVLVATKDRIYRYVNNGTRPHFIAPVRASALRFQSEYRPKTTPGSINSRAGGPSGDTVFALRAFHPGTTGRRFDEAIRAIWTPKTQEEFRKAVERGIRASGHEK